MSCVARVDADDGGGRRRRSASLRTSGSADPEAWKRAKCHLIVKTDCLFNHTRVARLSGSYQSTAQSLISANMSSQDNQPRCLTFKRTPVDSCRTPHSPRGRDIRSYSPLPTETSCAAAPWRGRQAATGEQHRTRLEQHRTGSWEALLGNRGAHWQLASSNDQRVVRQARRRCGATQIRLINREPREIDQAVRLAALGRSGATGRGHLLMHVISNLWGKKTQKNISVSLKHFQGVFRRDRTNLSQ